MLSIHDANERRYALRAADELDDVDHAVETAMNEITDALNKLSLVVERTQASGIREDDFQAARAQIRETVEELIGAQRLQLQRRAGG